MTKRYNSLKENANLQGTQLFDLTGRRLTIINSFDVSNQGNSVRSGVIIRKSSRGNLEKIMQFKN